MIEEHWRSVSEVKEQLNLELEPNKDYQVSNLGNFRTIDCDRNIKEGHITFSESQASVSINKQHILFHRLVALLFVKNDDPKNKTIVIYKDGNLRNNCAANLEWVSISERNEQRYIHQTATKKVRCIDEDLVFASATSAALYYNLTLEIIRHAIATNSVCFGHTFAYEEGHVNRNILYMSTRKAKSLSTMLTDIHQLRTYFDVVYVK